MSEHPPPQAIMKAPQHMIKVSHTTDEEWRKELVRTAACEMSAILDMLNEHAINGKEVEPNLWRGSYLRLDTLVSVAISASDDDRRTEELADEVYGAGAWLIAKGEEARHG